MRKTGKVIRMWTGPTVIECRPFLAESSMVPKDEGGVYTIHSRRGLGRMQDALEKLESGWEFLRGALCSPYPEGSALTRRQVVDTVREVCWR